VQLKGQINDLFKTQLDAYILRSMHRACNYNEVLIKHAYDCLLDEQDYRVYFIRNNTGLKMSEKIEYYLEQYNRSKVVDIAILDHMTVYGAMFLSIEHINALIAKCELMLEHKPFELVTIHDDYKAHANNINAMRKHYIDTLATLADGDVLSDIFTQLYNSKGIYPKLSNNLSTLIRNSNYALT